MTTTNLRLGYGGSAVISDTGGVNPIQVLITGGNMDEADAPSYIEMMDVPPTSDSRSRVLHADGTSDYMASINFDCTARALPLLSASRLLGRKYAFDVGIHDGQNAYDMSDCLITTLSVTGAPAGLIGVSMSVISKSGKSGALVSNNYLLDYTSSTDDQPMGYWWSGNTDVRDWTLTMNQSVEAIYLNENTMSSRYLKVGLIEYTLDVTTYTPQDHSSIIIATSAFTLTGVTTARGYAFGGVTELGSYSHSFATAADATVGSDESIITIA